MTIDLNRLNTLSKEQLIEIAKQTNTPYHHKNSEKTLIESIINKTMQKIMPKIPEEKEKVDVVYLTEQEVESAVAPIKEKHKAFSTIYNMEDGCVTLRYHDGRYTHAETLNLSNSLSKIKRKAQEIAKGPLLLAAHRSQDWEQLGTAQGKNSYTNVVLG